MNIVISWKIAAFLLLGIALIVFLALRYSSFFPSSAISGSPTPIPIPEKTLQYAPPRHFEQRRTAQPAPARNLVLPKPQKPQSPPQSKEPEEDEEEDPFFSPLT